MPHVIELKDQPHNLTEYKGKGTKISKFWNFLVNWGKFGNAISLWIEKNLEIYTAPDQRFKVQTLNLWMSWENLCPNLTFTLENKMRNSHKRGSSHFKININDWDIPFPKILRIYLWISIGENGMNPLSWIGNVLNWRLKYRS